MRELALFAGAGGGILGGHLLGWRTVCAVEWDAYAASVLVQRQNDGCLPPFAIWDDVQTFDGRPWRGRVDVISGGFPCTDISCAGKGAGIEGERSGMWGHMARIVGEVRPQFVFVENSPMLVGRGLARVLGDLASLGYDARWGIVGAHHVAAPHKRDRIWIVAHSRQQGLQGSGRPREANSVGKASRIERPGKAPELQEHVAHSHGERGRSRNAKRKNAGYAWEPSQHSGDESKGLGLWIAESNLGRGLPDELAGRVDINGTAAQGGLSRVGKGIPHRVDRLKCIGNGQVPQCAALAWKILSK